MMVKRVAIAGPTINIAAGSLANSLDKGFPYDDGDNSIDSQAPNWKKGAHPSDATNVGMLNGHNITRSNLKNLLRDTSSPITQELVQLEADEMKSDADNVGALFDSNITRGQLKNLITDKPAPITLKLAQKSDADNVGALFDSNITRGQLKNLITDKPAPITLKLAQKSDADNVGALFDSNITRG